MTPDPTARLRELMAAGPSGPWENIEWQCHAATTVVGGTGPHAIAECSSLGAHSDDAVPVAALICEMRNALPALLDELDKHREHDHCITWQVTCESCARAWDMSIAQYFETEELKERMTALLDRLAAAEKACEAAESYRARCIPIDGAPPGSDEWYALAVAMREALSAWRSLATGER